MNCTNCQHYRQRRGMKSGRMECAELAKGVACSSCLMSFPVMEWAHAALGFIRCPKCSKAKRIPGDDSPLVGFLGASTDPPAWCPGLVPIVAEKPEPPDKQRSLF